jgi:hypothetical protein
MPGFRFSMSKDGEMRASTWIEFRVSVNDLAITAAELAIVVAAKAEDPTVTPGLVLLSLTRHQVEKSHRQHLLVSGVGGREDLDPEVEELLPNAQEAIKVLFDVRTLTR